MSRSPTSLDSTTRLRIESIRSSDVAARRFRAAGLWRQSGAISDLFRWRDATPDARRSRPTGAMRGRPGSAMPNTPVVSSGSRARCTLGVRPGHPEHGVRLCEQRRRGAQLRARGCALHPAPADADRGAGQRPAVLFVGASMVLLDSWSGEWGLQVLTEAAPPRSWRRRASSTR